MGVTKEPPVSVKGQENGTCLMQQLLTQVGASNLCFSIRLIGQEVIWETILLGKTLFIEIPSDILPDGSKERFVFQHHVRLTHRGL